LTRFGCGTITLPPTPQEGFGGVVVGFGRDTDHNLIEIVCYPHAQHSFLSAVGIGVSNLQDPGLGPVASARGHSRRAGRAAVHPGSRTKRNCPARDSSRYSGGAEQCV
jgi:hypothetical protein